MSLKSKSVILCADDYGISPGENRAINHLAENNRISATSVMVCFDNWEAEAYRLLQLKDQLDIGLHFVLTDFNPVSKIDSIRTLINSKGRFFSVNLLVKKSLFKRIDEAEVWKEFSSQFEKFTKIFGFDPDFVDGHHNAHQYPVVRKVVINFLANKNYGYRPYVRNTFIPLKTITNQGGDFIKSGLISFWGGPFKKMAQIKNDPD